MNVVHDHAALRRYVLGSSSADERDRIEREYFDDPEALELVCAAEDDLIDEYLSNTLVGEERTRFEAYYLAVAPHRTRVGVARALRTAESPSNDRIASTWWTALLAVRGWPLVAPVAAAAALVLLAGVVVLWLRSTSGPDAAIVTTAPPPPAVTSPSAPTVREPREPEAPVKDKEPAAPSAVASIVALSISPINVRGTGEPAAISIPPDTNTVRLLLQGETSEPPLARGRVIVRTVPGREVWRGLTSRSTPASSLARVDIPAGRLPADDYIAQLLAPDASGREIERYRYFFSVRHGQDEKRR